MQKLSKKPFVSGFSSSGNVRHAKRFLQTLDPRIKGAVIGASALGGLGAAKSRSYNKKIEGKKTPTGRAKRKANTLRNAVITGTVGGIYGMVIGHAAHSHRASTKAWNNVFRGFRGGRRRGPGGYAPPPPGNRDPAPDWLKNVKTKADAQKTWKAHARKHHPDAGGDLEKMKKINAEWESFKRSDGFGKLAGVLPSLFDELLEIYAR